MTDSLLAPGYLLEDKYKIIGLVGEGAWGQVHEGLNVRIQRKVAIKVLKAEYAANEQMVKRFEREARAATHIESPHVVQVFDAGVLSDGRPYLVMEFLTGDDLSTRIQAEGGKLPIVTAVQLCAQVARGLGAAHASSIFHRDMKPGNIVIAKTRSGREIAKIVDFGISKVLDTKDSVSQTQTGTVLGSPVYMSPEQARGSKETDHRSDIYSLGVVLFETLTGTVPHQADGFNELLFKIVLEATPSAQALRPEIDDELEAILKRMLAKAPEVRFQTTAELETLLAQWLAANGGKSPDWLTESGPGDLKASPIAGAPGLSSGRLHAAVDQMQATVPVDSGNAPSEAVPSVAVSEPLPPTKPSVQPDEPAEEAAVAGDGAKTTASPVAKSVSKSSGARKGDASLTPSSSSTPTLPSPTPVRPKWMLPAVGAAAIAVVIGVIAVGSKGGGPPAAGSSAATAEPTVSMTGATSVAVPSFAVASAAPTEAVSASASASAAASAANDAASVSSAHAPHGPAIAVPVAPRPKASASATTAGGTAHPAASGTNPSSVGGRTIRTDL